MTKTVGNIDIRRRVETISRHTWQRNHTAHIWIRGRDTLAQDAHDTPEKRKHSQTKIIENHSQQTANATGVGEGPPGRTKWPQAVLVLTVNAPVNYLSLA